jgi:hypothetical protein
MKIVTEPKETSIELLVSYVQGNIQKVHAAKCYRPRQSTIAANSSSEKKEEEITFLFQVCVSCFQTSIIHI